MNPVSILGLPGDVLWLVLRKVINKHILRAFGFDNFDYLNAPADWWEEGGPPNYFTDSLAVLMQSFACVCKKFKDVIKRKCVKITPDSWSFRKCALDDRVL
jgi:hypothetical protein